MGDCVAWKPDIAPQAIVVKSIGIMGKFSESAIWFFSDVSSGMVYVPLLKKSIRRILSAITSSAIPKRGYMRPMSLSMGNRVASL
jgi:hypothetical protein